MSVLRPATLWSARINDPSITKGETDIIFAAGSGSSFSAVEEYQELWVGTSAGDDDIGRLRIRSITSGDGGVTGTVVVARNALEFSNNLFLTFKHTYPLKPKYPLIQGPPLTATFYKDGDITYSGQNNNTNPVCIAGENRAGFIDATLGYFEITSQLPNSYVTKSGATIVSYNAVAFPTTGVTINVNAGTGVGYIRFATEGIYWVKWSVADDNGQSQHTFRWYYAHTTSRTSTHYPDYQFDITQISGDWNRGGWETGITMHDEAALDEIPDKTPVILWQVASYNDTEENITFLPDSSNTIINGYVRKEKVEQDISDGLGDVDFQIQTIDALLKNHYMFSVSLAARSSPSQWYEYNSNLTIGNALHHFWKWHSTLFEVTDVFLGTDSLLRAYAEMEDGNLYTMADDLSRNKSIRAHVVCDKGNRVHLVYDIQLLRDTERALLSVVQSIEKSDRGDTITITREPYNRTAFVKTSGFSFTGTFSSTGCPDPPCPDVTPLCASAPGILPSDEGANVSDFDRQTFEDQTHANEMAGRFFAQINREYPEVRIDFPGNYLGVLEVMLEEFWTISLSTTDSVREIVWTNKNLILRTVTARFDVEKGTLVCSAVFEPEQDGFDGVAGYCLDDIPEPAGDPTVSLESTFEVAAFDDAGSCYVKSAGNWVVKNGSLTGSNILDHHGDQDPFWRSASKQNSTNPALAIMIKCNTGKIYRTTNEGTTWSDVTPTTNPPNSAGDTPSPGPDDLTYEQYEGDTITINRHYVAANQSVGGEWRSWIYMTDDDWATDNWVAITEAV